jgi:DNA-binding NtrC family response regulator
MQIPRETQKTLLVVDDDELLLEMVAGILETAGFRVFKANSGPSALKLAKETEEEIHLLLSDVDMKAMSGPQLGQALKTIRPDMRVMFMSGGDNGNLLVLNYGWAYIEKPFVVMKLVEMVSNVLHSPDRSQPGGYQFDTRTDTGHKT